MVDREDSRQYEFYLFSLLYTNGHDQTRAN